MRAVNLIPPEQRRGQRASSRTGPLPYVVVAGLALAVAGVTAVVLTNNDIADHKSEIAGLEAERRTTSREAQAYAPFVEFARLREARQATVTSLAQSRFDWERVLRELAIVLPNDVWLVEATGTVSPEVTVDGSTDIAVRETVTGPALQLVGCGASQRDVADFVAALKDIDGVTRVTVNAAERPEPEATEAGVGAGAGDAATTDDDCRTRDFISRFEIVAAFDAVPTPAGATAPPTDSTAPPPAESATPSEATPTSTESTPEPTP